MVKVKLQVHCEGMWVSLVVTVPDLCQGKELLVLLNRRLDVPQSHSGSYGKEINLLLLLTIELLLGVQPVAWSQY
jgi:hypothetical protein